MDTQKTRILQLAERSKNRPPALLRCCARGDSMRTRIAWRFPCRLDYGNSSREKILMCMCVCVGECGNGVSLWRSILENLSLYMNAWLSWDIILSLPSLVCYNRLLTCVLGFTILAINLLDHHILFLNTIINTHKYTCIFIAHICVI